MGQSVPNVSRLRTYWQQLDGEIHPADVDVLNGMPHSFNLDFPPPAFIGNVDTAKVFILRNNGGFNPEKTKLEFREEKDRRHHIDWLLGKRADRPERLSDWYTTKKWFPACELGQVALINAVAYRSPKFSKERDNAKIAKILPSRNFHREWLLDDIVPRADEGSALIIAHNWSAWGLSDGQFASENFIYSNSQVSQHLEKIILEKIRIFLRSSSSR